MYFLSTQNEPSTRENKEEILFDFSENLSTISLFYYKFYRENSAFNLIDFLPNIKPYTFTLGGFCSSGLDMIRLIFLLTFVWRHWFSLLTGTDIAKCLVPFQFPPCQVSTNLQSWLIHKSKFSSNISENNTFEILVIQH